MSLLTDHPHARLDGDPASYAARGPRRRRPLRHGLLVVALACVWAALPLGVRLAPDVEPSMPVAAGLMVPEYGARGTYAFHYRFHETITIEVPVRNSGPLPLTIDSVRLESPRLPLMVPVGGLEEPLRLGPFGSGTVSLTMRFDNCRYYHERSAQTWEQVRVSGSTLGRDFTRSVPLAFPLAVHGQVILDCPDRTLVRGDDVRE
ncbi:hypothetical protein DDE18_04815 [Nocardioides gansuensis]|uniref:Uncharacterized protein n=1 Tax=Nocardioides gansuensis TaxID=2138300 RepID=A0A2T8FD64_9ACTN|nr:hypothetical protein [Nocardioides gansuensis]PVG83651.1 hypothetical protein DDE18_04815 [Nocardioides gansuensis]